MIYFETVTFTYYISQIIAKRYIELHIKLFIRVFTSYFNLKDGSTDMCYA